MEHLTGGQAVVRSLLRHGVRHVFGVPGAQTYALYDALYDASAELQTLGVRHEQAAAYMAFGYAQSSGRPGVYTVVPGPGVLNTAAGLGTANACNVPVLCVAGQIPLNALGQGRGSLHELPDQLALLRGLTRWSERVSHPSVASQLLAEAWSKMCLGRRGAVALEVPWDVMMNAGPAPLIEPLPLQPAPSLADESIERAASSIAAAERPLIWVGSGALSANREVLELAELLGAPVASFRGGRGIVADDHPLALTLASAWHVWGKTDLLIVVGSRAEPPLMHWPQRSAPPAIVRIDIDPLEMVRRPALGVLGDAGEALRELVSALRRRGVKRRASAAELLEARAKATRELLDLQPQGEYLAAIRDVLPRDGFFVEDLCQVGYAAWSALPIYEPRTYVRCGYFASLGCGYATALGVKVAHPERAVVSVSGDGGFQFGLQELGTAAQHGIAVTSIVFDNKGYGNVRRDQRQGEPRRVLGSDFDGPDLLKLAESFGVGAERVATPAALREALDRSLASDRPRLIAVDVPRDSEASPWPFVFRRSAAR